VKNIRPNVNGRGSVALTVLMLIGIKRMIPLDECVKCEHGDVANLLVRPVFICYYALQVMLLKGARHV
jgi:hypothetical protein